MYVCMYIYIVAEIIRMFHSYDKLPEGIIILYAVIYIYIYKLI